MSSKHVWMFCAALALLATAAVGCKKATQEQAPPEKTGTGAAAGSGAADQVKGALSEIDRFLKDESAALTPQVLEQLVVALKDCKLTESGVERKCPAYETYNKARGRRTAMKNLMGMNARVGAKLIDHESPAVRYMAAGLMSSIFGSGKQTQDVVLAAARKEKDPVVLTKLLRVVGSRHKQNEEVKKLLLEMADHENEHVRTEALGWFTSSFGEGVEGTFEKVLEKLDKDPSIKVRRSLCRRLYGSSDKRAIKTLKRYLSDKATPDELYSECFNGLISAWTGFPQPATPNQEAWQLTLKLLRAKPRTDKRPPWSGISTLRAATDEAKTSFQREWLEKVKGWYKKATLVAALQDLAGDKQANWMARSAAVRTMGDLKAPKAAFEKLQKAYAGASGVDSHVGRAVEDALKKL